MPRILFVSTVFPFDLDRAVFGIFQRMRVLLDAAVAANADLRLLFFTSPAVVAAAPPPESLRLAFLERWGLNTTIELVAAGERVEEAWNTFAAPILDFARHRDYWPYAGTHQVAALESLAANCDLLIAHRLAAMIPALRARTKLPPIVFDLDDLEDVKMARELARPSNWNGRPLLRLQIPALRRLQRRAMKLAARTLVCSDHDRVHLLRSDADLPIATLENSVNTQIRQVDAPRRKRLLFVGALSYQPNLDAANFLIGEVWPRIAAMLPDARLVVAGNRPERLQAFGKAVPGVELAGFVDQLPALYASTDVVCCPILSGGGTRIKILEAAAHARPVVATSIGAEGLSFRTGEEILIADDAEGLANHCVALLSNHERAKTIGARARARVVAHHERSRTVTNLALLYRTLACPRRV